jgi:hypothetical protein
VVLCASADNEGWERRTWLVYHGIDRVPKDVVAEDLKATVEVEFLDHHFGLKTLDVSLSDAVQDGGVTARIYKLEDFVSSRFERLRSSSSITCAGRRTVE